MQNLDDQICTLLKQHKVEGLKLLFDVYYRPLVLWADTYLNQLDYAEDVVQDFFVKLWERGLGDKLVAQTLKSYLFTAVKNRALNVLERFDPLKEAYDVASVNCIQFEYDDLTEKLLGKVEAEIEKLAPRSREVVKGVYVEGLSYKEVAQKLDITVSTVKTLLVNALKQLREACVHVNEILMLFFSKKLRFDSTVL